MNTHGKIVRMGMVGGGPNSFIGPVHRMAAELDGRIALVAGVFSGDAERNRAAGQGYGLAPERIYPDVETMLKAEAQRADDINFLSIVTPNHLHHAAAMAALQAGVHVMSEKPPTVSLAEAHDIARVAGVSGREYALTYTYAGYPMVREARALCRSGRLGAIRKVAVEYSQGWLSAAPEREGQKQAAWRTDPAQAGPAGCLGDIGVHAFHLAEYVSGLRTAKLSSDLNTLVPGRALDDDCNVLLGFGNGASGVLMASQIAAGDRNGLRLRIWGERGGLDWSQEQPNVLNVHWLDGPSQVYHAGAGGLSQEAGRVTRLPTGHPEGFIEALANLYGDFATMVTGGSLPEREVLPGIADGVRSMAFIECAIASSQRKQWLPLEERVT